MKNKENRICILLCEQQLIGSKNEKYVFGEETHTSPHFQKSKFFMPELLLKELWLFPAENNS